jgi:glycosyltransferase involved in cell wall biosynthesis
MSNQELPLVAVLIPTYERPEILEKTVNLLLANLKYEGKFKILIGDDGHLPPVSPPKFEGDYFFHGEQYGLGKNLNSLLQEAAQQGIDYVIQMDDDHWLVKPLDITPHVNKLMEDELAGCIRLMGIGGHHYTATLSGSYWRINWNSAELYIASNRPHLKSISRFHEVYGPYPEGLKLGLTEEAFCHHCIDTWRLKSAASQYAPDVLIPLDLQTESSWEHSEQHGGISWQQKGF